MQCPKLDPEDLRVWPSQVGGPHAESSRPCGYLDPRTFPVEQIAELVHALPAPGVPIDVADVPGATEAVAWLEDHGRPARLIPAPEAPQPTQLWSPSPGLLSLLELPPGKALDLGCGTGRDAVALAMRGWSVTAVDRLPDALDRARSLAELHGVTLDLRVVDIDKEPLPVGPFDLVTAFRYLPDLEIMAEAVAPSGSLVVETFTDRERARTGKPRDASLVLPAIDPPILPAGFTLRDYRIHTVDGRELAFLWSEKLNRF